MCLCGSWHKTVIECHFVKFYIRMLEMVLWRQWSERRWWIADAKKKLFHCGDGLDNDSFSLNEIVMTLREDISCCLWASETREMKQFVVKIPIAGKKRQKIIWLLKKAQSTYQLWWRKGHQASRWNEPFPTMNTLWSMTSSQHKNNNQTID